MMVITVVIIDDHNSGNHTNYIDDDLHSGKLYDGDRNSGSHMMMILTLVITVVILMMIITLVII